MPAKKNQGLGLRHLKILKFLVKYQEEHGFPPSIRNIGDDVGVKSTSLIDYYLKYLEKEKYIEREKNTSRGVKVVNLPPELQSTDVFSRFAKTTADVAQKVLNVPMWGQIYASNPIPVPEDRTPDSTIAIPRGMISEKEDPDKLFALEVKGDSMIDAMINEGDIVIMKQAESAVNGEMVAVWLDDDNETTLKYFFKEKDHIRLQPANPTMGPIIINKKRPLRIMGKVIMVIRQMDKKPFSSPISA